MVVANGAGEISDRPGLAPACRIAEYIAPMEEERLIPLPEGSRLYFLPARDALGYGHDGTLHKAGDCAMAVAAFLPPGYVALSLAAFHRRHESHELPLNCYASVCWHRGGMHVDAIRIDPDRRHDPGQFDDAKVARAVARGTRRYPGNRLIRHHGETCAMRYGCPNAMNFFLGRWEAPVAVSGTCNAACRGCISGIESDAIQPPQERIAFTPTVDEIVELAVPHLERAPKAIVSFGQGCEGEPLVRWKLVADAIRAIRRRTRRGTLHMNTNGSMPVAVGKLAEAGLDSIRISLNSARKDIYEAYHGCRGYGFADAVKSMTVARKAGLWVSLNYLTFPGVTDDRPENEAMDDLIESTGINMIQWRNLNIDPDVYMDLVDKVAGARREPLGIAVRIADIRKKFPAVRHGYFNPAGAAVEKWIG